MKRFLENHDETFQSGEVSGLLKALRIMNDEFGKADSYYTFAEALKRSSERINELIKTLNEKNESN